ncbi:MAG: carbohydrate ABC transporter permease [Ilumatobacter sp.]|uniref:carbohydrate ABC transporter permease n=1 Tax=Ilumatobacter sp. TaxID=1967498 RepID=UPI00391AAA6A
MGTPTDAETEPLADAAIVVPDSTITPWARGRLPRHHYRIPLATGQRLVVGWHLVAVLAALLALFATLDPSSDDDGLPGAIKLLVLVLNGLAVFGHAYSAFGVRRVVRRARTVSLITNYLFFVLAAAAALHQFGFFLGIGSFGEGLNKAFLPFLVVLVGVLWIAFARTMIERAPTSLAAVRLRLAGRVLAVVGGVWFVVRADPSGMIGAIGDGLTTPMTLATLAVAIGSALSVAHMWNPRVAAHFGTSAAESQALSGLAFLSPNIIGFMFFFAGPLAFSFVVSFFDWSTTNTTKDFVLFDNYIRALSIDFASAPQANAGTEVLKDGYQVLANLDWFGQNWVIGARDIEFWISLRNIAVFLVLAVPLSVLPALGLSTVLASKLPGMKVFRAIYFVPSVAGVIGVSIVWGQLFQSTVGWINYLILRAGEILPFLDPPAEGQAWLSDRSTALFAIVVVFAWMNFGFNTVLYLAGHQGIAKDLYEAAEIDGASPWRTFRRITVPQLANTSFYVVSLTSITALQLFDIVWVLSRPEPGGPNNATTTPVIALYEEAFVNNSTGYASSLAWILFMLIFGLTFGQFRRQRNTVGAS